MVETCPLKPTPKHNVHTHFHAHKHTCTHIFINMPPVGGLPGLFNTCPHPHHIYTSLPTHPHALFLDLSLSSPGLHWFRHAQARSHPDQNRHTGCAHSHTSTWIHMQRHCFSLTKWQHTHSQVQTEHRNKDTCTEKPTCIQVHRHTGTDTCKKHH